MSETQAAYTVERRPRAANDRFAREDFPTAEVIADLLRPKACTEHMPFKGHRTCAEWGPDDL